MYRIFGFLGIRRVRGISVSVHAAGVSVRVAVLWAVLWWGAVAACSPVTIGHSGRG